MRLGLGCAGPLRFGRVRHASQLQAKAVQGLAYEVRAGFEMLGQLGSAATLCQHLLDFRLSRAPLACPASGCDGQALQTIALEVVAHRAPGEAEVLGQLRLCRGWCQACKFVGELGQVHGLICCGRSDAVPMNYRIHVRKVGPKVGGQLGGGVRFCEQLQFVFARFPANVLDFALNAELAQDVADALAGGVVFRCQLLVVHRQRVACEFFAAVLPVPVW